MAAAAAAVPSNTQTNGGPTGSRRHCGPAVTAPSPLLTQKVATCCLLSQKSNYGWTGWVWRMKASRLSSAKAPEPIRRRQEERERACHLPGWCQQVSGVFVRNTQNSVSHAKSAHPSSPRNIGWGARYAGRPRCNPILAEAGRCCICHQRLEDTDATRCKARQRPQYSHGGGAAAAAPTFVTRHPRALQLPWILSVPWATCCSRMHSGSSLTYDRLATAPQRHWHAQPCHNRNPLRPRCSRCVPWA